MPCSSCRRESRSRIWGLNGNVQSGGRFVGNQELGLGGYGHGNHGALALAAGKLGQVAVGEVLQVELGKRFFDNGFVVFRRPALVVGIAAEHEQVAHGNAAHDAVFLGEDGERAGEFGGGRGFDVFACVADVARVPRAAGAP